MLDLVGNPEDSYGTQRILGVQNFPVCYDWAAFSVADSFSTADLPEGVQSRGGGQSLDPALAAERDLPRMPCQFTGSGSSLHAEMYGQVC